MPVPLLHATRDWLHSSIPKDNVLREYDVQRVTLLDGLGDFAPARHKFNEICLLMDVGLEYPQIAEMSGLREIDVILIALHLRTDENGRVNWRCG